MGLRVTTRIPSKICCRNTKTLLCTLSEPTTFSIWIHLCTLIERKFFRLIFRFPFLWFPLGEFGKLAYLVPCGFGGTAGRESVVEFGRELRWLESPLLVLACDRHFEYIWWQLPIVKSEKERGHSHLCTAIHRHILLPVHMFTPFLQRLLSHCLALLFVFDELFIADLRNDGGDTLLVDALTHSLVLQMMRGVPSAD